MSARICILAFFALLSGIIPHAAGTPSASPFILVPVQLQMGGAQGIMGPLPPERKAITAPLHAMPQAPAVQNQRLAQALSQLTPKQRKQLVKAIKHMTPEQRTQFAVMLQRQLSGK
jgi:hypothetical protein